MKESSLAAVHEQEDGADTETEKFPPLAGTLMNGVVKMSQVPTWFTVTVWPATVRVPVRDPNPSDHGATLKVTLPLPLPLAPLVTAMKDALLMAVHSHTLVAVTVIVAVPPNGAKNVNEVVDRAYVHARPDWCTVTVWPAMVSVPERAGPVLASIEKVTVPLSIPELPELTAMKASLLLAVHAQPVAGVVTATVPVPPFDGNGALAPLSVNVHTVRGSTISRRAFEEIETVSVAV